ncbi:hypothetical protein D3C72_1204000 [compost metagenome]
MALAHQGSAGQYRLRGHGAGHADHLGQSFDRRAQQIPECFDRVGQWRLLVFQQWLWWLERFAQLHRNSPEIIDFVLTHPATVVECYQGSRPLRPVRVVH